MIRLQVRLATRNTLRRKVRTALTAGMVMLGVALLVLALSWIRGALGGALATAAAHGGEVRIVKPAFALREELMPLEENLPDVGELTSRLRAVPGVVAVEPRIATGVTVTVGEEIGDVFAQAVGAQESYLRERLGLKEKLAVGSWFTGGADELIAGAKVAEQVGAKVGDELVLLGMTQDGSLSPIKGRLVGIVQAGTPGADLQIFAPLAKLQWLTDIPEGATELLLYGERYDEAVSLAGAVRGAPGMDRYTVQAWSEREPYKSIGETAKGMEGIIALVIVFIAALGIWNTLMMSVLERTSEIGVLRALGLSRVGAVGLFVGESLAIGIVGGLLGAGLGAIPAALLERYGVRIGARAASQMSIAVSERIHANLTPEILLTAFALGILMSVLGSALPALRASSIQPVTAMRSGR